MSPPGPGILPRPPRRLVPPITSHPIRFGSGEWVCLTGEMEGYGRMVTVAKWRDGAIAEEHIWN